MKFLMMNRIALRAWMCVAHVAGCVLTLYGMHFVFVWMYEFDFFLLLVVVWLVFLGSVYMRVWVVHCFA